MKAFKYYFVACLLITACSRKMATEAPGSESEASAVVVSSGTNKVPLIPACIQKKIDSIKQQPVWNPPAEIHRYELDGKKVFLTSSRCCDFWGEAFDENCNYICAPSGGFTGKGDGKCADFFERAKLVGLVWKDERARKAP